MLGTDRAWTWKRLSAATGLLLTLVATPAHAAIPRGNLILNPGAEAGPGATNAFTALPPPAWISTGSFTAVRYGSAGFPTVAQGGAISGGQNFFAGGPRIGENAAGQILNVSSAASEIDAGLVGATLSGQMGGREDESDHMAVEATFVNGAGAPIEELEIDPVTEGDRNGQTGFVASAEVGVVPSGTRAIVVRMEALGLEGAYQDAYVDNLDLTLAPAGLNHLPPAQVGRAVNIAVVKGKVFLQEAGGGAANASQAKGRRFVPLRSARQVPVGSLLDTRRGTVRLVSATGAAGRTQTGDFQGGVFQVLQSRRRGAKGLTQLRLKGSSFKRCPRARGRTAQSAGQRRIRRLRGSGRGRFQTRGRYASATVRGTAWTTTDRCDGTLTKVRRGTVAVRDFRRRRTIVLRAGRSYLARAPG